MDEGRFRRDLYDRLAFEVVELPPLRERLEDVRVLAEHFLERFRDEVSGLTVRSLAPAALERLRTYDFPGNVRELKNVVERAAYSARGEVLQPGDIDAALPPAPRARRPLAEMASWDDAALPLLARVEAFERAICMDALEKARYNQREAAEILGLTYDQFRQRKRKYGLLKE
jgi:DNA-binding NtrC family response regulator